MAKRTPSLFELSVHELAHQLVGKELKLPDGRTITITSTEPYARADNNRGAYRPILEMQPGQVYVARIMNAFMFLIVAREGEEVGACVRIIGIDTSEAGEIEGGGRVGKYVGFVEHKQIGRIEERAGHPLTLIMEGTLAPEIPATNGGSKVKLTDRVLGRYADEIGAHFMAHPIEAESYNDFLERIKREWVNEAELKKQLGLA
ncbi:hypothetical protein HQ487_04485 [Candidatus Uhrbacteria bacterium]|nr:hypothetical protein [Candidatus Uhrbacteria bacterium]